MRTFDNPHYYKILEVNETASQEEISTAFRRLSKEYHPDRVPLDLSRLKHEAQEKFKEINEAYCVLSDPEKRRQYDAYLEVLRETEKASKYHAKDYHEAPSADEEPDTEQEREGVVITCPYCEQKLRVPEGQVLQVRCPSCDEIFVYPFTEHSKKKDFITIGSSKEEVLEVLGQPDKTTLSVSISFSVSRKWYYGSSYIIFRDDKVYEYYQSPLGKDLRIKIEETPKEEHRGTERSWDEQFQYQNKSREGMGEKSKQAEPPTSGELPRIGIWLRVFAYTIDFSILACGMEALLWYVYLSIYPNQVIFLGYFLVFPLYFVYFMFLQSHGRQTIGERFVGIKVFPLSEALLTKKKAVLRYLCCLIPFYGLATIPSLLNSKQSIADVIIKTQVLQIRKVARIRFVLPIGLLIFWAWVESAARKENFEKTTPSQVSMVAQPPKHAERSSLPRQETGTSTLSTQDIASMYWNSAVSISTYDSYSQNVGQGSGFVVSPDGVIVTNNHVVKPGQTPLIIFPNKTYYYASVLKRDSINDIAILKIKADNLPIIPLGESGKISVGDKIVVIGSLLGLQNTVTEGIVSAIRVSEDKRIKILQISAPISPGSSGSPVINMLGQCVGIATMYVEKGQNLNFAVPIEYVISLQSEGTMPTLESYVEDMIKALTSEGYQDSPQLRQLLKDRFEKKYTLSIPKVSESPPPLSLFTGLVVSQGEQWVRVIEIKPGCPSARAGLQVEDLILVINGQKVKTLEEFVKVSEENGRTTEVNLLILRKGTLLEKRLDWILIYLGPD